MLILLRAVIHVHLHTVAIGQPLLLGLRNRLHVIQCNKARLDFNLHHVRLLVCGQLFSEVNRNRAGSRGSVAFDLDRCCCRGGLARRLRAAALGRLCGQKLPRGAVIHRAFIRRDINR